MIWDFFKKQPARQLVNGAQDTVEITTKTYDVAAPLWLAETYKLARHLSEGDRSVVVAANQTLNAGDAPTLMTGEGSVTQELWARMTEFGYLVDAPAETLTSTTKAWQVLPGRHQAWLMFLLAAKVDMFTDDVALPISKGLAKARGLFMNTPPQLLRMFRVGTIRADAPFAEGSIRGPHFDVFERLGLARIEGKQWVATQPGSLVLPFFMDHILCMKGEDE